MNLQQYSWFITVHNDCSSIDNNRMLIDDDDNQYLNFNGD